MRNTIGRFCKYYSRYNPYEFLEEASCNLNENGSFENIDYSCTSRSRWDVSNHLRYSASLALEYNRTKLMKYSLMANRALAYWVKHDFKNSNWWHNDIGVPQMLMHTAIFLGDAIESENFEYIETRLRDNVEEKWTGANKLWLAEIVICKGLLTNQESLVKNGSDLIKSTVFISPRYEEGIQLDYSFAQHGMQLYNHGYGLDYVVNASKWAYILYASRFAFNNDLIAVLTDYVLNGAYKMIRYDRMDFHPRSREIVRGCIGQVGDMVRHISVIESLLELNAEHEKCNKLKQAYAHIVNHERMPALEGNQMYWCLGYMTHVKEAYYASVRWASNEILGGDIQHGTPVNSENLLAGFAAYGGTCYMVSGREYENIAPVWDWGLLPGTTTPHVELPIEIGGLHDTTFMGGVSDGTVGVIAADMHKRYTYDEDVSFAGRMSSFMFDDVIVHLGNGIQSDTKHELNTTYNQCLLNGDVLVDKSTVKQNHFTNGTYSSVHHDNIAYFNLENAELTLDTRPKQGSWHKVYAADNISDEIIKKDLFTLYQLQNKSGGSYAYAVVPGIDRDTYMKYDINAQISVLSNDAVQAVCDKHTNKIGAVFYAPCKLSCDAITISVSAACIMLLDLKERCIFVCDPEQKNEIIRVSIELDEMQYEIDVTISNARCDKGEAEKVKF